MEKITINNFRSFKNQELNFSKINILIGENSSGKSSFLKFILALKQSILDKNTNLTLFGDSVDLGNYQDIVYYNDTNEVLTFQFEFGSKYVNYYFNFISGLNTKLSDAKMEQYKQEVEKYLGESVKFPSSAQFTLNENLDQHSSLKIVFSNKALGTLTIEHKKREIDNLITDNLLGESGICNLVFKSENESYILENIEYNPESFMSIVLSNSLKKHCDENIKDSAVFFKIAFLLITQNYLKTRLQKIKFVNPIDAKPERFYYKRDNSNSPKMNIAKVINILGDKKLPPELKARFLKAINDALVNFGLAESIEILNDEKISVFELKIKIKSLISNITDVGYGVSLQLPIIFQAVLSEILGGEIVLIEQPEVHLHPKLQANFIETIINIGPHNTYFIETHSEHIIRKLQSLAKNSPKKIAREDISIHYFKRENDRFVVTPHNIGEDFRLSPNLPSGFFDSSYLLAKELF